MNDSQLQRRFENIMLVTFILELSMSLGFSASTVVCELRIAFNVEYFSTSTAFTPNRCTTESIKWKSFFSLKLLILKMRRVSIDGTRN